jgi:hypothetical protein
MTVYIFVDARSLANFIDDVHNVLCATHSESLMLSRKTRRSVNLFLVISYNTTFNRIRIRNHIHLQRHPPTTRPRDKVTANTAPPPCVAWNTRSSPAAIPPTTQSTASSRRHSAHSSTEVGV